MSWVKSSGVALIALLLPAAAAAAPSAVHVRHHHHHFRTVGPAPGWDLYGPPGDYGPRDGGFYPSGELYSRESGGVNSMSNDFGTSGVLGHTNGMPATGR